jgi:8-amino-7-oxononanoate synthase
VGTRLDAELAEDLARREALGLLRRLPRPDPGPVDFCSNDTLGLARDPRLIEAGRAALAEHGAGGRASRLLGGGAVTHETLEAAAARWLGEEAALLFPSGYQANLGLVTSLVGRGDALFSDRLNHASLIDAARLSRGRVHVFGHLDLAELGRQLEREAPARRRLVLVEGVFSMDGDLAPLPEIDALCARYDAWWILDEAHSVGLLGPGGAGAWAATGLTAERLIGRVVTGGKALGASGALVVGSRALCDLLVNRARSFWFTTAPGPALAATLLAGIEAAREADDARQRACGLARQLAESLGLPTPAAAIVPVPIGDPVQAVEVAERLREHGFAVAAVRPPTVPPGGSRLRLVCHATNRPEEVDELARRLHELGALTSTKRSVRTLEAPAAALTVVGTDTGIGKTVVSALLARAARKAGRAAYWKPVQTGEESDTEAVRRLADLAPHECLRPAWQLPLPASPHAAAADAGQSIDMRRLEEGLRGLRRTLTGTRIVVELAGGLLVPYRIEPRLETQADWLARTGEAHVLVARSGLGTLNHTLLTLEALRSRHLEPRALFLVGEPHPSNRATLGRVAGVAKVFEVPVLEPLTPSALDAWLAANDLAPLFDA